MTNELGHKLRALVGDQMTLGAYRGGNRGCWIPGATIDTWVPCARGEIVTGVPFPHVYFIQTIGEHGADSSIYCPECRVEVAARRAQGSSAPPPPPKKAAPAPAPASRPIDPGQSDLPF